MSEPKIPKRGEIYEAMCGNSVCENLRELILSTVRAYLEKAEEIARTRLHFANKNQPKAAFPIYWDGQSSASNEIAEGIKALREGLK